MPTSINLDILYSSGGFSNERQKIIISAKIYLKYETVYYTEKSDNLFHIEFKSIGNFIKLEKSNLEKEIEHPSIIPALPLDIVNPLTNEIDF